MAIVQAGGRPVMKPRSDIYTGLLGISLAAMIAGCVFLYLDYSQYQGKKPEAPPSPSAVRSAAGQPAQPGR
jgi:hypothetical protein